MERCESCVTFCVTCEKQSTCIDCYGPRCCYLGKDLFVCMCEYLERIGETNVGTFYRKSTEIEKRQLKRAKPFLLISENRVTF